MKYFASASKLPNRLRRILSQELEPGEQPKWLAQPESHEFQEDQRLIQVFGMVFALFPIVLTWKHLFRPENAVHGPFGLYIGVGIFGAFGLHLVSIPIVARFRAKRVLYVFTNRRALLISHGLIFGKTVHSFAGRRLLKAKVARKANGVGDINFARYKIENPDWAQPAIEYLGFSNIPNVDRVLPILEEVQTNARSA